MLSSSKLSFKLPLLLAITGCFRCDMKISYLLTFHRAQSTVTLRKALLVGQEVDSGGVDGVITLLALNRERLLSANNNEGSPV